MNARIHDAIAGTAARLRQVGTALAAAWRPTRDDDREFLPAALEIVETPPNPLGRMMALAICALFLISLIWAYFGKVDIVAVARGMVVPVEGVKKVQPLEIGIVRSILVENGQRVKQGDLLIALDPTETDVDQDQVARRHEEADLEVRRLEALMNGIEGGRADFKLPQGAAASLQEGASHHLLADLEAFRSSIASLQALRRQRQAQRDEAAQQIEKSKAILPLLEERERMMDALARDGFGSRVALLEVREKKLDMQLGLRALEYRLQDAEQAILALNQQIIGKRSEFKQTVMEKLRSARQQFDVNTMDLRKAAKRRNQQELRAPIDGVVQQLQVRTVGGVVTPAETLMVVVPHDAPLEVLCRVLNKDVGFIRVGQTAAVKVEAFPYTKYGFIEGSVKKVAQDATADDKIGLVYDTTIRLDATHIRTDEGDKMLSPGMGVDVEIRTGERRIIEYILSPLQQYKEEVLKER
jgi:hemolysin D